MKSILERGKEYVLSVYGTQYTDCELAFIRGVQSEHEELTRWNSPESPPTGYTGELLLKLRNKEAKISDGIFFAISRFVNGKFLLHHDNRDDHVEIIGWREIHE